jgi:hypothetical protein
LPHSLYINKLTGSAPSGIVNPKNLFHVSLHTYVTRTLPLDLGLNASFTSFEISLSEIRSSNLANLYKEGKLQKEQLKGKHLD